MSTLTESIQGMQTSQLFSSLAARTGVPDSKVRTATNAATTAIMEGLADHAHNPRAMAEVTSLISQTPDLDDPTMVLDDGAPVRRSGNDLLRIATPDVSAMRDRLGRMLGIGSSAASSVLGTAAGLVMGGLRRFSRSIGGLDASTLSSMLTAERPALHDAMPVDLTDTGRITRPSVRPSERTTFRRARHEGRRNNAWLLLLALIPIALLAFWLVERPKKGTEEPISTAPLVKEPAKTAEPSSTGTVPEAPALNPPTSPEEPSMGPSTKTQQEPSGATGTEAPSTMTAPGTEPSTTAPGTEPSTMTPSDSGSTPRAGVEPSTPTSESAGTEPSKPADTAAAEPSKPADTAAAEPSTPSDTAAAEPSTPADTTATEPPPTVAGVTITKSDTATEGLEPSTPTSESAGTEPSKPADTAAAEPSKPADTTAAEPSKPADTAANEVSKAADTAANEVSKAADTATNEVSKAADTVASGEPVTSPSDTTAAEPTKPADTTAAEPSKPTTATEPEKPADTTAAAPSEPAMSAEPAKTAATLDFAKGSAESALLLATTNKSDAKKGSWIVLDDVKFDTGATKVSDDAANQLANVAEVLEQNPDVKIELGGFTDAPGSLRKNREVSQERADSVRQALIDKGVDAKRIEAKGYGEENLVQETEAASEVNRRVAVRIIATR